MIQAGFCLLLFASVLDITDNFPSLDQYVVMGDTPTEAFLEKIVGYLGGFVVLGIGLVRWIPTIQRLSDEIELRKEAQQALEENATWYTMAAQAATLGHWHFDAIKDAYIDISNEYAKIFGYSVDDFLDRYRVLDDDMNLVHPDDRQRVLDYYHLNRDYAVIDYRILHQDGEFRHVREITKLTRDASGIVVEAMGTLQDVTELKNAQFEAEQATRAKSEFLSRMSHELRTPMNAVLGFAQLLELDTSLNENQKKYVGHINDGGKHLLSLINEILDLERIEAGKIELNMEPVNLSEIMQECEQLTQSLTKKHQVPLKNLIPAGSPVLVWADKMRLKQALINLVTNAVKYNREDGQVEVSCEDAVNGQICIKVRDTGLGISEEDMTNLFEPFSRQGAEKSDIEGTGIGLTITRKLVEIMGVKLHVESAPGTGSTFSIVLRTGT